MCQGCPYCDCVCVCVYEQKLPCCSLCGLLGHLLRTCPNRHCSNCSLPGHTYDDCLEKAYWHKCCHRCGMTGHFIDVSSSLWECVFVSECNVLHCVLLVCLCVYLSLGPFFLSLRQTLHRLWVGHTLHSSPPTTTPLREIEMGEEEKQVTFRNNKRDERENI